MIDGIKERCFYDDYDLESLLKYGKEELDNIFRKKSNKAHHFGRLALIEVCFNMVGESVFSDIDRTAFRNILNRMPPKEYERYKHFLRLSEWIKRNYYFTLAHYVSTQRDCLRLKTLSEETAFIQRLTTSLIKTNPNTNYKDLSKVYKEQQDTISSLLLMDRESRIDALDNIRTNLQFSFKCIYSYNIVINMLAEYYEVPNLKVYQVDGIDSLESLAEIIQQMDNVRAEIESSDFLQTYEKQDQLSIMQNTADLFRNLDALPTADGEELVNSFDTENFTYDDAIAFKYLYKEKND